LNWSPAQYGVICLAVGVVGFFLALGFAGASPAVAALMGFSAGLGLPHLHVGLSRKRRLNALLDELPDALDAIVRGVRSGLPLSDCLHLIAVEGREPLRGEMRQFVDDMTIGLTIEEAGDRLYRRAPMLETKLLGIIFNIQSRAGGNLSEAVGNLSRVLRDRKKMKSKVRAMSTEATASAAIIASLPVLVGCALYVMSPDYVGLLFSTDIGHFLLGGSAFWMLCGVLVMRNMINFEV
jgi:tight adherence protein B